MAILTISIVLEILLIVAYLVLKISQELYIYWKKKGVKKEKKKYFEAVWVKDYSYTQKDNEA